MRHRRLCAFLLAGAVAVSGCADLRRSSKANKPAAERKAVANRAPGAWPLAALTGHTAPVIELRGDKREVLASVPTANLRSYEEAARRLEAVAGVTPYYLLAEGDAPNAFAWYASAAPVIAVNIGMLGLLGDDLDLWAAVVGHEIAHLKFRHQMQRQERHATSDAATGALGFALAIVGIPFGLVLADGAATAVDRGYSRDDEREADAAAVSYMQQAGFNPQGALRFHELLAGLDRRRSASIFGTHPAGEERVANMRALLEAPPASAVK